MFARAAQIFAPENQTRAAPAAWTDSMSTSKRGHRRVVDTSESDESAADLVNCKQPSELQNPQELVEVSSDEGSSESATDLVKRKQSPEPRNPQELSEVSSDEGSSDSADPVSRKARKLAVRMAQKMNPFTFAMKHGKFPNPTQQQHTEHPHLTDPGYLWNALPPRNCQYLDLEAAHAGSDTSEGSTGSSDGSLADSNFIDKETPQDTPTAEELQMLQSFFPKTFSPKKLQKHSPQSPIKIHESDASGSQVHHFRKKGHVVLVNGIIQFPIWRRAPVRSHPTSHQH